MYLSQMGLSRVNVGANMNLGGNSSQQNGASNISPRGGGGGGVNSNYHFGAGGNSNNHNSASFNPNSSQHQHQHLMNGVVPRELLNTGTNSPHNNLNNTNSNGFHSNNGAANGGTSSASVHRKHRGNSRQSGNKSSRRHHNRHGDSGGGNPAAAAGNDSRYSGQQQPPSHAAGAFGPGSAYHHPHQQHQQQQQSQNNNHHHHSSNAAGGGDGHSNGYASSHHGQHQHGQQQQSHNNNNGMLPHIGGASGPGLLLSAVQGPGTKNNSANNVLALGSTGGMLGGGRTAYLSSMNHPNSSSASPSATMLGSTYGGTSNGTATATAAAAYTGAIVTPVAREFQQGNVLTNTEEHGHSAVTSIRGMKPGNPNWINQDNFFVTENFESRDIRIYCVLDGHGEHGHLVSRRCREMFPQFIKSARMDIDGAFNMMQNDLNSASDMDVRCSGATCVMATLIGGKLSVYNCGDSRAVLGRRNPNGSVYAMAMSKDHKPDRADERKRILSCGGHLGCRQVLVNQPGRGPVSMPVGPCRVWYQHRGETLGLAMSRSLGDSIVHKSGVSAEPECIERVIDDYDDFLILATDGVWDVVDNNYAVQLVQSFAAKSANWSPIEATNSLCRFARSRWEKLSPMIDDISCIVVKIHR